MNIVDKLTNKAQLTIIQANRIVIFFNNWPIAYLKPYDSSL